MEDAVGGQGAEVDAIVGQSQSKSSKLMDKEIHNIANNNPCGKKEMWSEEWSTKGGKVG